MRPERRPCPLLPGVVLIGMLMGSGGCSFFKWTDPDGPAGPGIVVLERKAAGDIQGFNVYRVNQEDGTETQVNSRIVEPASEIADERGLLTYRVIDRGVLAGETYYYLFEEVRKDGSKHRWETPQMMTASPL